MNRAKIYNIGDIVEHDNFGKGIVLNKIKNKQGTPIYIVEFYTEGKSYPINARYQGMKKIKGE